LSAFKELVVIRILLPAARAVGGTACSLSDRLGEPRPNPPFDDDRRPSPHSPQVGTCLHRSKEIGVTLKLAAVVLAGMAACSHPGSPAPRLERADIGGTTLAYVEQGRGETVVFVHGAAGDWRTWEPLRPHISARYRFVSYSRRYHHPNPSDGGGGSYTAAQHADDLIKFVRTIGVGPVHGVGASAGGRVLADAAVKQPDLFKSLTLSEPLITKPTSPEGLAHWTAGSQEFGKVVAAVRAGDARQATVNLIDWVYAEPGAFDKLPADSRQRFLDNRGTVIQMVTAAPAAPPSCEQLGALPMPVMVMEGEDTRAGFRAMNERLVQCLRGGSRRVTVPGAPHVWYPVNPKSGAERLLEFLSSVR
jgi:pimeloyl-ACP methyl ester carboxylesterase